MTKSLQGIRRVGRTERRGGRGASGRGRRWWGGVGGWVGRSPLWLYTVRTTPALQLGRPQAAAEPPVSPGRVWAWVGRGRAWVGGIMLGLFCTPPPLPHIHRLRRYESMENPFAPLKGRGLSYLAVASCSCPAALRKHRAPEGLGSKIL